MNLKIKHIIEGWKNLATRPDEFREEAEKRAAICADCSENIVNVCYKCGCYIPAKTWSPDEECPEGKWKEYNTNENDK